MQDPMGYETVKWGGLGFFAWLYGTTYATAFFGGLFLIVAWIMRRFGAHPSGQGSISLPLWMFTGAILLDAVAITLIGRDERLSLPFFALVFCWVFLITALVLARKKRGPAMDTLKVGSIILLVIGGIGLVSLMWGTLEGSVWVL